MNDWRPVIGFWDLYEVSRRGDVRRLRYINGQTNRKLDKPESCKQREAIGGYMIVRLSNFRLKIHSQTCLVHKLVLEAFCTERPPGFETAHLDGNPKNNHIDNLAWVTPRANELMKRLHGTHRPRRKREMANVGN